MLTHATTSTPTYPYRHQGAVLRVSEPTSPFGADAAEVRASWPGLLPEFTPGAPLPIGLMIPMIVIGGLLGRLYGVLILSLLDNAPGSPSANAAAAAFANAAFAAEPGLFALTGATAVMDAFWTLYFSKQLNLSAALPRMEPVAVAEDAPLELPCTGAGYDANAAGDTSVAEARCMWQWKPS